MSPTLTIRTAADLAKDARARLRARIKARRNMAIAAGTTVGGTPVQTDDLSQQHITGAVQAAMLDATTEVRWKVGDGQFLTLDAPSIIVIGQAVRAHVQACFDREADLLALIDAGEAPDIDTGWPQP